MLETLLGESHQSAVNDEIALMAKKLRELATAVSAAMDSDILFFSGGIDRVSLKAFQKCLRERPTRRTNVLLMLTTVGGDPHCAYRIISRLQSTYDTGQLAVFVHSTCASAGTLMAIGAHNLVMSDTAEFGPLDIQLAKTDDLVARMSGLTPSQAMSTLRQQAYSCFEDVFLQLLGRSNFRLSVKTASDIAVQLTTGLYEPIYGQIDPLRLGEVQRDNRIAYEYGQRLNRGNLKDEALTRLINSYPAHGFVIDRMEAETHIFDNVRPPSPSELELAELLEKFMEQSAEDDETVVAYICPPRTITSAENTDASSTTSQHDPKEHKTSTDINQDSSKAGNGGDHPDCVPDQERESSDSERRVEDPG